MLPKYRHGRPTIGVLAGWQFSWTATPLSYLDPIFQGTCLAAHDLGCNVLLGCGMGSWTNRRDSLRPAWPLLSPECDFVPIGPWNADGLIAVNPLHSQDRSLYIQDLIAAGHPVVFIASGEVGPTIVADNRSGVLDAMQHFIEHGHQSVAFIAGSPDDIAGDSGIRLRAYSDAVEIHGLPSDPRLVAWGRHLFDGGYLAMQDILASGSAFSAVLASNDESALGAMQALREAGRHIPRDIAIVGFDDRPESGLQKPALSSVRIPLQKMGYRAVESLFRYLTGRTDAIESASVATRLVPRESCGCGQSAVPINVRSAVVPNAEVQYRGAASERLIEIMAAPILAEAQGLPDSEIKASCQRLVDALDASVEQEDASMFQDTLEAVLRQVAASGDDVHMWQAALTGLADALDRYTIDDLSSPSAHRARKWLDQARTTISANVQRQYRQHVMDQRWMLNRLGTLTARLLAARDETQVYEVLAQHLPAMNIHSMWVASFQAEGDDPVSWSTLRVITPSARRSPHFPSREFPPQGLLPEAQPFSLALFPLTGPRGQLGYVVFDTAHLDLYGAIAQQLATALNSAQLYREASEGRRLAEEANALKSRFLSTVSHELRTPLNLVVGLSGILLQEGDERDKPLPELYRKDIEQIYANAQHLGGLIGDVLDLASSDAGQLRLTHEFVDLSQAMRLVVDTGRQLAYDKGLAWRATLPDTGPWVWGDRTRLRQIVLNLISNAVKFTAQGQVCLSLESGLDSVIIAVTDTGMGVPPEEQPSIFDEFRRSDRSAARGYGGLGLGLAICKRLVEMHGGTIGVRSSGEEGVGSTFHFSLPTVETPDSEVPSPTIASRHEESVLVLTNRTGSGQRLIEHLHARGFEVQTLFLDDSPDWLSLLVSAPPAAIVVDVNATAHSGWDVLKSIKAHPKTLHLPVLFYALSPDGGSVLELDYLTKPIELADLTRALDQHWLAPDAESDLKTILVVDDDPGTLEMHARIVQAHSPAHRVVTALNGFEALDILRREPIDLVVLDLMMPELDGFGVLEAMRSEENTPEVPVIVLTGQVLSVDDMSLLNRGVTTVLSKGLFSFEETLIHVDTALGRNRKLSSEAQRLVRQAMAYIHAHYAEPISRSDLARRVALSEDYLTVCFRKELGVTPIAYLNRYRVNQARQLLIDTDKSVTEIALEVGFSDSGYFSRVFRREVGSSPEAYRQSRFPL